ncbi:MAG: SBBP repeat-containing protein, partial [Bacteroidota bacterium]
MPEKKKYKRVPALFVVLLSISISAYSQGSLTADKFSGVPGFIENKGQLFGYDGQRHDEVKYIFESGDLQLFVNEKGISYQFTKVTFPEKKQEEFKLRAVQLKEELNKNRDRGTVETFRMDMVLEGSNPHPTISREDQNDAVFHYYNKNVVNVHSYNRLVFHEVYPGIDWAIYLNNGQVKYDFIVKVGADHSMLKLKFTDTERISLNEKGCLRLDCPLGSVTENKPVSFQDGKKISTNFVLDKNVISFSIAAYQKDRPLVIDPAIVWSTYYSGAAGSEGSGSASDASGNVYLVGYTASTSSIASGGYQNSIGGNTDAFLAKFNASGNLLWATYYGGVEDDFGQACAVDQSGNVFLTGIANSTTNIASGGFQNSHAGIVDAFVVKFDALGIRQWASYYGGPGGDLGRACTVDASGNIYISGYTTSPTGIASGGYQNSKAQFDSGFLAKFTTAGALLWATYYGEDGTSCVTDNSGNVFLTGITGATSGIASVGAHQTVIGGGGLPTIDGFLVKFNSSGGRLWGTYYGGWGDDLSTSVSADAAGNVFMSGYTSSTFTITSNGFQNTFGGGFYDSFIVKFNSGGVRQWGSYYGGSGNEQHAYCLADPSGAVYLAGITSSTIGIASGGFQNNKNGSTDAFLVKFDASGIRLWGTYFGGSGSDKFQGAISTHTPSGSIYASGSSGSNSGVALGGHQVTPPTTSFKAILVKICDGVSGQSPISGPTLACNGSTLSYSGSNMTGATSYSWSLPSGWSGASSTNSILVTAGTGTGNISLSASTACGVLYPQTLAVIVNNTSPAPPAISGSSIVCSSAVAAYSVTPDPNVGFYTWSLPPGWSGSQVAAAITATAGSSGSFSVTAVNGCGTSTQQYSVTVPSSSTLSVNSATICSGNSVTIVPGGANTYTVTGNNFVVSPTNTSTYSITGSDVYGCRASNTVISTVSVNITPTINVTSGTICSGKSFTILPGGANTYSITGNTFTVTPILTSTYLVTGTGTNNCVSTNTAVSIVSVNITPTITVNSGTICTGKSFTILPSGANTYTVNGNLFTVSPALTSTYLVTGTATNNCVGSNTAVSIVSVNITPTVSANSGSICSGIFFTITPSGASIYTVTGNNFTVSPALTSTYLVTGTATNNCVSSNTAVSIVSVNITPTVSVNSGSICSGQSFTIIPSGANTYTVSGNSFTVSPVQNNTYLVTGTGTNNCVSGNTASAIVLVAVSPTLSVNSGSICSGQVFTLNPSGAGTYSVTGNSLNVSPVMTSTYLVTGTGTNNCAATNTAVSILTVAITPTVSINSGSICAGQAFTLVPSGAFNYTISGGSYTVSPMVSSSYLLQGISSEGCLSANLAVSSITVDALP